MKKVLLAFDGGHFSKGAFEFARALHQNKSILLTGLFLPQIDYANIPSFSGGGVGDPLFLPLMGDENKEMIEKNVECFVSLCKENKIEYGVQNEFYDFALPEIKKETRFADLLIIGSQSFYRNLAPADAQEYLEYILHGVECPVIVVPEKFVFPKNNILAYDGSDSSVYAIKQFTYLLPELAANNTLLVYVNEEIGRPIPEKEKIEELAARHFPDLTITKLEMNPKRYFATWIGEINAPILVTGSFGRSGISGFFRKSFSSKIISDHNLPIFIAHQR